MPKIPETFTRSNIMNMYIFIIKDYEWHIHRNDNYLRKWYAKLATHKGYDNTLLSCKIWAKSLPEMKIKIQEWTKEIK
jgi:hypothetical protein